MDTEIDGWKDGCMERQMERQIVVIDGRKTDGWKSEWKARDKWMGAWVDRRMDEWGARQQISVTHDSRSLLSTTVL